MSLRINTTNKAITSLLLPLPMLLISITTKATITLLSTKDIFKLTHFLLLSLLTELWDFNLLKLSLDLRSDHSSSSSSPSLNHLHPHLAFILAFLFLISFPPSHPPTHHNSYLESQCVIEDWWGGEEGWCSEGYDADSSSATFSLLPYFFLNSSPSPVE
jgi:hypothetical protein